MASLLGVFSKGMACFIASGERRFFSLAWPLMFLARIAVRVFDFNDKGVVA